MMNRYQRRRLATTGILLGFLFGLPTSSGADDKTAPGSACTFTDEGPDRPTLSSLGRVGNPDTNSDQTVVCPIARETWTVPDDLEVYVYDGSSSDDVTCRLWHHLDGDNGFVYGDPVSSSGSNVYATLQPDIDTTEYSYGAYTVTCSLPPVGSSTSWVQGYWWQE
jgi:hypothetical protein